MNLLRITDSRGKVWYINLNQIKTIEPRSEINGDVFFWIYFDERKIIPVDTEQFNEIVARIRSRSNVILS